jgi:hypothetical protein
MSGKTTTDTNENERKIDFAIRGSLGIAGRKVTYSVGAGKAPGSIRLMVEAPAAEEAAQAMDFLTRILGQHLAKTAGSR